MLGGVSGVRKKTFGKISRLQPASKPSSQPCVFKRVQLQQLFSNPAQPAASTHASSQHPHVQPAPTLAASTHACSHHDTHPSLVHSRVFSNECNSNNLSNRAQPACSQHPRVQRAPTFAASTHACSQHDMLAASITRLQVAPTLAASTHACSQHLRLRPAPTLAPTMTNLPPA